MTVQAAYQNRKDAHIRLAADDAPATLNQFDELAFVHHSLSGINRHDVDLHTTIAGLECPKPLYINAMTGGSDMARRINHELATVANEFGLPMAAGSMSAFLANPAAADTYSVIRKANPTGIVIANINANTGPVDAQRAVDLLHADALQIHLNSVQEIVMPEGDRDFAHWERAVAEITAAVSVPVIVKEVGFGMSRETFRVLTGLGVAAVDVAGRGGTDFASIENRRRDRQNYDYLTGWGQSAAGSLLEIQRSPGQPELLASGGVRNPLDVVKALALGAGAVGVAGHFLRIVIDDGADELATVVGDWLEQLTSLMTVLGAHSVAALVNTDLLITGTLAERSIRRGVDLSACANRSASVSGELHQ
ncbi:type 2 isopentenyl-diphosphate Delta-isomerase [Nocardia salmonicida]|uniref:type 2 isopentenyl-diphosphate Delta-isomerase n=2 Tax=Nocardia salmonicida TaxID=53431 RepID=UPI00364EA4FC